VVPLTAASGEVHVQTLTKDLATRFADELIAMLGDIEWDYWGRDQLLAHRDEKWERSLLATQGGEPVGWAVVSRTERGAHLHHLVVAKEARSRGIGALLMAEALRRTGLGVLTLKVHPDNDAAVRFYVRMGFLEKRDDAGEYRLFSRSVRDGAERVS